MSFFYKALRAGGARFALGNRSLWSRVTVGGDKDFKAAKDFKDFKVVWIWGGSTFI